jgi:hypothetical protein
MMTTRTVQAIESAAVAKGHRRAFLCSLEWAPSVEAKVDVLSGQNPVWTGHGSPDTTRS